MTLTCGVQNEASSFLEAEVIYYKCFVTVNIGPVKSKESKTNFYSSIENQWYICLSATGVDQQPNWLHWRKWTLIFAFNRPCRFTSQANNIRVSTAPHKFYTPLTSILCYRLYDTILCPAVFCLTNKLWYMKEAKYYGSTIFYSGNKSNLCE